MRVYCAWQDGKESVRKYLLGGRGRGRGKLRRKAGSAEEGCRLGRGSSAGCSGGEVKGFLLFTGILSAGREADGGRLRNFGRNFMAVRNYLEG